MTKFSNKFKKHYFWPTFGASFFFHKNSGSVMKKKLMTQCQEIFQAEGLKNGKMEARTDRP